MRLVIRRLLTGRECSSFVARVISMAVTDADLIRRFHQRRDELGINRRSGLTRLADSVWAALSSAEAGGRGQHAVQVTHSPIEVILEDLLVQYLAPATRKTAQRTVSTPFGRYRPDFFLVDPVTRRVLVLECDGREYHDRVRDAWRDAAMLGCGAVHDLLRIEGKDLKRRPHDVLHLLARLFPTLFLPRALLVLDREATAEARAFRFAVDGSATLYFPPPSRRFTTEADEPIDDSVDDTPVGVHWEGALPEGEFDDFLNFDLRGTSRYASRAWRFRYEALRARTDLTLDQLAERERRTGSIG